MTETASTPGDKGSAHSAISPPLFRGLTRRRVLGGAAGVGGIAVLAACGSKGTKDNTAPVTVPDKSDTEKLVNWSNWPEYIDVDDKTQAHPTLDTFTKQSGIKVNYTEDVNDNDEFFAKIQPLLSKGADCGRDTFVPAPTGWSARLIRLGWVQKLDQANIPNIKNLDPSLLHVPFDEGRVYSLPWQSGFTGIGYNPKSTGGEKIETIDQLLTDPKLKGKVTLLTEMRDTVGLVMIELGIDPATFTDDQIRRRHREDPDGRRCRPDRQLHGQRLRQGTGVRRHRRMHGVDRRRRPAPGRQPQPRLQAAGQGPHGSGRTTS